MSSELFPDLEPMKKAMRGLENEMNKLPHLKIFIDQNTLDVTLVDGPSQKFRYTLSATISREVR